MSDAHNESTRLVGDLKAVASEHGFEMQEFEDIDDMFAAFKGISRAEMDEELAREMEANGDHPAYVYAVRKTGSYVTEDLRFMFEHRSMAKERERFDQAVAEYMAAHPDAQPLNGLFTDEAARRDFEQFGGS